MDRKALLARRKRFQRQRDAELRACRTKWRIRINSLNRRLRGIATARDITSRTKRGPASPVAMYADTVKGKLRRNGKDHAIEVVRQTLRHYQGFFTARMLVQVINQTKPFSVTDRGILNPLCRLRKLGEIKLVDKGNGRQPHMYLKI